LNKLIAIMLLMVTCVSCTLLTRIATDPAVDKDIEQTAEDVIKDL